MAKRHHNPRHFVGLDSELHQDKELMELLDSFSAHRSELGKPITPTAATMLIGRLERMGLKQAKEALRQSIECGWQGVFPPKESQDHGRLGDKYGRPDDRPD